MAHPFDLDEVVAGIKTVVSDILQTDVTAWRGFSERQVRAMAKQAAWVAEATSKGELDDDMRNFFLDSLEDMARNFAHTLRGLLVITIEKIWNAVVNVLWGAIQQATNIVLPFPI